MNSRRRRWVLAFILVLGSLLLINSTISAIKYIDVEFNTQGIRSDYSGSVLTLDGISYSVDALPIKQTWLIGSVHTFEFLSPISDDSYQAVSMVSYSDPTEGYHWNKTVGLTTARAGRISLHISGNITGVYNLLENTPETAQVVFTQTGVGADYSGIIVIIDGQGYNRTELPKTFDWVIGSCHTYSFSTPLPVDSFVGYSWNSTEGIVTERFGEMTVFSAGGLVNGVYVQYDTSPKFVQITFNQTGVGLDYSGKLLKVDSTEFLVNNLPHTFSWQTGSNHSFEYYTPLAGIGRSYEWISTNGLTILRNGSLTVSVTGNVTGKYYLVSPPVERYEVTFSQVGIGIDYSGAIVRVDDIDYSLGNLPKSFTWEKGSTHSYWFYSPLNVNTNKHYIHQSTSGITSERFGEITVNTSGEVIGTYYVTYHPIRQVVEVTFDATGISDDYTGTILTVDEVTYSHATLPVTLSWTIGTSHNFTFNTPLPIDEIYSYAWNSTTGSASTQYGEITANIPGTITGHYQIEINPDVKKIQGIKFNDLNVNGLKDNDEKGLPNWAIELRSSNGTLLESTITNEDGYYMFYVVPGSYNVKEVPQSGWINTGPLSINVAVTESDVIVYFSNVELSTAYMLSGKVFNDTNHNSVEDVGESGVEGILVSLSPSLNVTTNESGLYSFIIPSGNYSISIHMDPPTICTTMNPVEIDTDDYSTHEIIVDYGVFELYYYSVTFTQTGSAVTPLVNYSFNGTSGSAKTPFSIMVPGGFELSYTYQPVKFETFDIRYVLQNVLPESPITITTSITVTGSYERQVRVTFDQTGLGSDAQGIILKFNGYTRYVSGLPYSFFVNSTQTVVYEYTEIVPSSIPGKRYQLKSVNGTTSPITTTVPLKVVGDYSGLGGVQYLITFNATGFSNAAGKILTVDGESVEVSELAYSIWVNAGSSLPFTYEVYVYAGEGTRYILQGVSDESPLVVDTATSVSAVYGGEDGVEHLISFSQSGLGLDAVSTVVIVDGSVLSVAEIPYGFWAVEGSVVNYAYEEYVYNTDATVRYSIINVTGPASEFTVSSPESIVGFYCGEDDAEYMITFTQTGSEVKVVVNYNINGTSDSRCVPFSIWVPNNSILSYTYQSIKFETFDIRYVLQKVTLESPITIIASITITGSYERQVRVTFDQTGLGSDAQGVILKFNSYTRWVLGLPYSFFVNSTETVVYEYTEIVPSNIPGKRYQLTSLSGVASPITTTVPLKIVGNYSGLSGVQYLINFNATGYSDATGKILTVDGESVEISELTYSVWVNAGVYLDFEYEGYITNAAEDTRYLLKSVDIGSPLLVDGPKTVSAEYGGDKGIEYKVTFSQSGLGSDAASAVLHVNGTNLYCSDMPMSLWIKSSNNLTYSYEQYVYSSTLGVRYPRTSITGPSSPINMTSPVTVVGNYDIGEGVEYRIRFNATGFPLGAIGPVVTVNGTSVDKSLLPYEIWSKAGKIIVYQYEIYVYSDTGFVRYALLNATGPATGFSVTKSEDIIGYYEGECEYRVTFTKVCSVDPVNVTYTIDSGMPIIATAPFSIWVPNNSTLTYTYSETLAISEGARSALTSITPISPQTVTNSLEVIGYYTTQYYLTLISPYGSTTGQGWYNTGVMANFTVAPTVLVNSMVQAIFQKWTSTSIGGYTGSLANSFVIMNNPITETAQWKIQYNITFTQLGLSTDAKGTVVTINGSNCTLSSLPRTIWADQGSQFTYQYMEYILTKDADTRYHLQQVLGPADPMTVTGPATIIGDYSGVYSVEYRLIVRIEPASLNITNISINPTGMYEITSQGWTSFWYPNATQVTITAVPTSMGANREIYYFNHWKIDASSSINPLPVTMNTKMMIMAAYTLKTLQ